MEDPNDFFNSSPGAKSVATTTAGARSTIKKASRAYRYDEDDEDDDAAYDEDGNDMQDDEGTFSTQVSFRFGYLLWSLTAGGHEFLGRHIHLAADLSASTSLYRPRPFGSPSFDLCLRREVRLAQGSLVPASERTRQFGEQVSRRTSEAVVQLWWWRGRNGGGRAAVR